ncbi:MAG: glycosyltransferase family 4 protein [Candidatus Nealsonbacteria bacterium]|nr:glycosyltransferase family 4 protein [Candidatus Nealsonbacteria bacterium]
MKVALISFHSFYQPGGVKRHVLGLYKEFRKRGVECKIIAPRRKREEYYGKNVILLGTSFPFPFNGAISDLAINFNSLAIEDTLKREKFDVLHFHNFGLPSTLQILASPAASDTLNILTFHASLEGSKFMKRFPAVLGLINKICQWKIDGIIGVAPFNLKYFKEYSGPKTIIPNGIDLEKFNPQVEKIKKFLDGKINILFLGRIEERKGLIYLLKAYKILEKTPPFGPKGGVRLIIVGEGPLKEDLEKWVKINKLKNVIFEGKVPEEKVASYYKSCDIYCSPAIFGESFGLVLVEAMACQKPVVAFANKGYKEVLTGKGARFLAKPRDYKTLAKKLEILIKNEKLREEMGQWGVEEAKKYSWQKVANQVLNFYQPSWQNKQKREKTKSFSLEKQIDKIFNEIF